MLHRCSDAVVSCSPAFSSVLARIMTCQCFGLLTSQLLIRFLAVSSFTRFPRDLSFGLPRFRFPWHILLPSVISFSWPHIYPTFSDFTHSKPSHPLLSVTLRNYAIGYFSYTFPILSSIFTLSLFCICKYVPK